MITLFEPAYAKINLTLDVLGKREDGYHDLKSVMQTISLRDDIEIDVGTGKPWVLRCDKEGIPCDERNLAWKAAKLYCETMGKDPNGLEIRITKRIPSEAGLGGGSADAAAVLRGLNRLCGDRLSIEELCALGATLGADIPFCIKGGGALVTGIGECLEEVISMPQTPLVVACMGEGVSTPWAYGKLDEAHGGFVSPAPTDARPDRILRAMENGATEAACESFYNIFEEIVPTVQPYVERLKTTMRESGAVHAMMSGSGPSVFGVFGSVEAATAAVERLREMGAAAFVCHPREKY